MGEAKRRKKLDPNYGKVRNTIRPSDKIIDEWRQRRLQEIEEARELLSFYSNQERLQPYEMALKELLSMCFADTRDEGSRAPFLENEQNEEKVLEIGEQLYRLGGTSAMYWVIERVPSFDQPELDMVWDGIWSRDD